MCTLSDSWALHRVKNCMEIFLYLISILVFDVDVFLDLFYDKKCLHFWHVFFISKYLVYRLNSSNVSANSQFWLAVF